MKNSILFAFALVVALLVTSCDKEVMSTKTVVDVDNKDRMATIVINGFADLDFKTFGSENVPDGTKVLLSANKGSFISGAQGDLMLEFEFVGGQVVAEVPTTETGVVYTITPIDFEYEAITNPLTYEVSKLMMRYSINSSFVPSVIIGESEVKNIFYGATKSDVQFREWVTLSGEVKGEFDESNNDFNEDLDETVELIFTDVNNTWYKSVMTNGAKFEVSVPKYETIICYYNFEHEKNVWQLGGTYDDEDYIYEGSEVFGPFGSDAVRDFHVGTGVED